MACQWHELAQRTFYRNWELYVVCYRYKNLIPPLPNVKVLSVPKVASPLPLIPTYPLIITMVYAVALLANVLLASAAFAAPSTKKSTLGARVARRAAGRQSLPNNRITPSGLEPATGNTSHVEYSSNWAGAVWDSYPSVRCIPNLSHNENNMLTYFILGIFRVHSNLSPVPSSSPPPLAARVPPLPGLVLTVTPAEPQFSRLV